MVKKQDKNISVSSDQLSDEIYRLIETVIDTATFERHLINQLRIDIIGGIVLLYVLKEVDLEPGMGYNVTVNLKKEVVPLVIGSIVNDGITQYMFSEP